MLGVGIVFSYLFLTVYALLHEGSHGNLNSHPRLNYCLGVVTGLIFGGPFAMIRVTHQGHHSRNRTDPEIFDLYTDTDSRFLKTVQWYGTLAGLFWPFVPISAVLISICPGAVRSRLFTRPPLGNANLGDLDAGDVWRMRGELLLLAAVLTGLHSWLALAGVVRLRQLQLVDPSVHRPRLHQARHYRWGVEPGTQLVDVAVAAFWRVGPDPSPPARGALDLPASHHSHHGTEIGVPCAVLAAVDRSPSDRRARALGSGGSRDGCGRWVASSGLTC